MASSFPGSIDSFTDPLANSALSSPSHAGLHSDVNDAIEKVETYMGLVKVIPTSVTGGTLASNGTITVGSAVSSVVVGGAFSALYDNYKITYHAGAGSTSNSVQITLGASTTGYYGVLIYSAASPASVTAAGHANSASFAYAGYMDGSLATLDFDLLSPFLAKWTQLANASWMPPATFGTYNGTHQVATSYTGFSVVPASGTLTNGTIRIYGYRN